MAAAGFADGIKGVKLYANQVQGQLIQADLKAIGIEVELITGAFKDWRDKIRKGEVHLMHYGWAASFPYAADYVSAWTTCASIKTGYNDGNYCNPKIDDLYASAEKLPLLDEKRVAAYRQIEDLVINQDVGWVGLISRKAVRLSKAVVRDVNLEFLVGWPRLETVWMQKA
jgi:ABC-type transport system substrate-binding protein